MDEESKIPVNFTPLHNQPSKHKKPSRIFLFAGLFSIFITVVIIGLVGYRLQQKKPLPTEKPKAACSWYAPNYQCPSNWNFNTSDCVNAVDPNSNPPNKNCCCTSGAAPQPTSAGNCEQQYYNNNKCFKIVGGNCNPSGSIRTFTGRFSGGCPNQGGTDVPAEKDKEYCADAQSGQCVQVDWLGTGGVCDCKPEVSATNTPTATLTPVPSTTITPTITPSVTPTLTPSPTKTPTPSPTKTPTPSPTVIASGTPAPTATQTPTPTSTLVPAATATSTPGPSATPTNTPTPTEIILAQATSTPAVTVSRTPTTSSSIPSAGIQPPWYLILIPASLLILGLLF